MNRTDRLYALVEELRAVSPRPRSATWLARHFEVSARTIERDLDALRQSGAPIWSRHGRTGGYVLDRDRTLPPLSLTPAEALAISVALRSAAGSPFAREARSAAHKILAALPPDVRRREEALAAQVHRVGGHPVAARCARTVADAIGQQRALRLVYADRCGVPSEREAEPLGLLWGTAGWYLVAWCRRRGAVRGFRLDRVLAADLLERVEPRPDERDLQRELARLDATPLREM